jgi:tRNA U34 5-carboxymethylaminomethyl modifying GTPase MnmE/TrmE
MALKLQQSTEVNISLQQELGASNARCEILDARCQNLNLELENVKNIWTSEPDDQDWRTEISMSNSQNPAQADSFYREKVELLNREIESRMANLCLSQEDDILSEDRAMRLLAILRTVHPHGSDTAAMFQTTSQVSAFHQDMRLRIVIVRHVIALLLLDRVFSSFAVGREIGISNCLREYEETKKLLSMNRSMVQN